MLGGVYCAFSAEEPEARLDLCMKECNATALLVHSLTADRLKNGVPKAVAHTHKSYVERLPLFEKSNIMRSGDTILQRTPVTYIVHHHDTFGCLYFGACLVFLRPGSHRDVDYTLDTIQAHQISTLTITPTFLAALVDDGQDLDKLEPLQAVLCIGEPLMSSRARRLYARLPTHTKLLHGYGQTEGAVLAACHEISIEDTFSDNTIVSFGRPLPGSQCLVLDDHLQRVIPGQIGELFINGPSIFSGYVHRPDLTRSALVTVPNQKGVFYRTGDLVRLDPSTSKLYFVGRKDFQIKLRGQRIESGEIEHILCQFSFPSSLSNNEHTTNRVRQAIITKCEHLGLEHLVAYVQRPNVDHPQDEQKDSDEEIQHKLRLHCEKHLPLHMIPSLFVILAHFPLNKNGKVDRKALPKPNFTEIIDKSQQNELVAPRTATEHRVLDIWKECLDLSNISVTANFFTLGGNSLLLMRLVHRYRQQFADRKNVVMADFIKIPTVMNHAVLLDQASM